MHKTVESRRADFVIVDYYVGATKLERPNKRMFPALAHVAYVVHASDVAP